jgi:hypothetical protein
MSLGNKHRQTSLYHDDVERAALGRAGRWLASTGLSLLTLVLVSPGEAAILGTTLGTLAPPGQIGGILISALPSDARPVFESVTGVPGQPPLAGDVTFDRSLTHYQIGQGWTSWSHGYAGHVYWTGVGGRLVKICYPVGTAAVLFYVQPRQSQLVSVTAWANDDPNVSFTQNISGTGGAAGFAFYGSDSSVTIHCVWVQVGMGFDFALGEFFGGQWPEAETGACCLNSGSCTITSQQQCWDWGGTYKGDHSACFPSLCPQPGACCLPPDSHCWNVTEAQCTAAGGVFAGDFGDDDCALNPCRRGACCIVGQECVIAPEAACTNWGGIYQGNLTKCDPSPCSDWGACCDEYGQCAVVLEIDCLTTGRVYRGDGIMCDDPMYACPPSAYLSGVVWDAATHDPLPGLRVSIGGLIPEITYTDPNGRFDFAEVWPGGRLVRVTDESGTYIGATRDVGMYPPDHYTLYFSLEPRATGDARPALSDVTGQYCNARKHARYIQGVSLTENFTATVNWKDHEPGTIKTVQGELLNPPYFGTYHLSRAMGTDFQVGQTLTLVAYAADGTASPPRVANFSIIPAPPGLELTSKQRSGDVLQYAANALTIMEEGLPDGTIPSNIPLFGKKALRFAGVARGFGPLMDGSAHFAMEGKEKRIRIGGVDLFCQFAGAGGWDYDHDSGSWSVDGAIDASAGADVQIPVPALEICWPNPITVWPSICLELEGHLTADVAAHLEFNDWAFYGAPDWEGSVSLNPEASVDVLVGVPPFLCVGVYLGGGLRMVIVFPEQPHLKKAQIYLVGGLVATSFGFEGRIPVLEYTWDLGSQRWAVHQGELAYGLIPRDYLQRPVGYAVFVANDGAPHTRSVTSETPLQLNVYSPSTPDLAAAGSDLTSVWVYDDTDRMPINRSAVVASHYDAALQTWSTPVEVDDDGTADFHPRVAALPGGDVLAVWENASEVLIDPGAPGDPCIETCNQQCVGDPDPNACISRCQFKCKAREMGRKLDISTARYSAATGQWQPAVALTSNTWLDSTPRIAAASDGTAIVVWTSNPDSDILVEGNTPDDLHCALYDGVNWSAAMDLDQGTTRVMGISLAYDGARAVVIVAGDTDGDLSTTADQELFAANWSAGSWSALARLTNDGAQDATPQVAFDSSGTLVLVWYSAGDLVMATDLSLADRRVVYHPTGATSTLRDFRLARGSSGRIALLWQGASLDMVDLWYATYEPVRSVWSQPQRLTTDDAQETEVAPVLDAAGDLVAVYAKVQHEYETRTVEVGGEQITVNNIPAPGQTDLYCLRHVISGDLAIASAEVTLSPSNPTPGQTVTVTASVRNIGDQPAADVALAFYDGDPASGGPLVGTAVNAGLLAGGQQAELSLDWLLTASNQPRNLYVIVDPGLVQEDRDRTNNVAIVPGVGQPDLRADYLTSTIEGEDGADRLLTARVVNESGVAVNGTTVTLRRDSVAGELLATLPVAGPLSPGTPVDVTWLWENAGPFGSGPLRVIAIVDETNTVAEYAEDNNTFTTLVWPRVVVSDCNRNGNADAVDIASGFSTDANGNGIPDECEMIGDMNCDGAVTFADINPFVLALSGQHSYLTRYPDCNWLYADINGDGVVSYADINPFVRLLSGS